MAPIPPAFFVTGTDTGVGKTVVSSILCRGLNAAYWKPIQSGMEGQTDTELVKELTQLPAENFFPETYKLSQPLSPHASAKIDGLEIELPKFSLPEYKQKHLLVEGAGGIMVPLNSRLLVIDLIAHLQLPVIVVARSGLGTINHTLLTVSKLRDYKLNIVGVIMNGQLNKGNKEAIEHFGQVKVIAQLPPLAELTPSAIAAAFAEHCATSFAEKPRSNTGIV